MVFFSPAKINVHLAVGNLRPDGYHRICSWFLKISLYDEIDVDLRAREQIIVEGNSQVPMGDDLMAKAARLFFAETGLPPRCRISIRKQIPVGAGLGGGSGNAATVLMALNHMHGGPLSSTELRSLGEQLGSDVPFFLGGPSAVVTGRGEISDEIHTLRSWPVVVVDPGFAISTKRAYVWLDEAGSESRGDGLDAARIKAMVEGDPGGWRFYNDFSRVLYIRYPLLRSICGRLLELGALHAGVSGSGSACFGLFESPADASKAAKNFQDTRCWKKETLASCGNAVLQWERSADGARRSHGDY